MLSRDEFLYYLLKMREQVEGVAPIKFWRRMEIELDKFTKTDDMKNTVFPPGEPTPMTSAQFKNYSEEKKVKQIEELKNTETLLSRGIIFHFYKFYQRWKKID